MKSAGAVAGNLPTTQVIIFATECQLQNLSPEAIMPAPQGDGSLAKSRKLLLRLSTHPRDFT
jgi:hypothetical protein